MIKIKKALSLKVILLIIIGIPLLQSIAYSTAVNDLRIPLSGNSKEGQERLKDTMLMLTSRPELDKVLGQRAFSGVAYQLISGIGTDDTVKNGSGDTVKLDLNWTGINDNIQIVFLEREDFDQRNPVLINGQYRKDGQYRPYIKTIENDSITYFLPHNITINELSYLIEDIDSLTKNKPHRLKLSNVFSQRFKFTAIYLAREVPWDKLSDQQKESLERQVELIYLLGGMFEEKPNHEIISLDEIKLRTLDLPDDKAWRIFKNHLKADLKLTPETLNQPGKLIEWAKETVKHMAQEVKAGKITQLEYAIFIKGAEEMYSGLGVEYDPVKAAIRELKALFQQPLERLLKDNLPLQTWRERLKKAGPAEEIEVVKEVIGIVEKYKGWESKTSLDWSPKGILETQELNCVGRAILVSRILKEIGIEESRLYAATTPGHVFLILELSDKSYFMIETLMGNSFIIQDIPRGYISSNLATQDDIIIRFPRPIFVSYPETQFFNVSSLTNGLMASLHLNLGVAINSSIFGARLDDKAIAEYRKAIRLTPKSASAHRALGSKLLGKSRILKSLDPEQSISLLDEAIYHSRIAVMFNRNDSLNHLQLGLSLQAKSKVVIGFKDKIKLLDRAIVEYNKAMSLEYDDEIKKSLLIAEAEKFVITKEYKSNLAGKLSQHTASKETAISL